jgi:hypothetical protein
MAGRPVSPLLRLKWPTTRSDCGDGYRQAKNTFVALVDRYHAPMIRLARSFVPTRPVTEEALRLRGLDRDQGRLWTERDGP